MIQKPKVTVYIPVHNYGRFLDRSVQSILNQTFTDWELIIIDDGSTDDSMTYINRYSDHPKITTLSQENKGLNATNNVAIRLSRGQYIMRLDADDYLDENCLLVLSTILDQKPEVGLVYPDYYHIDEEGKEIEVVRRKKIGDEVELLDLPCHGACTMVRRDVLINIGSYSEDFSCQDGYDLWIKLISQYKPYNVNIPLFYYRQHQNSLTRNESKILDTRREIKRSFIEKNGRHVPKTLGVIPVLKAGIYKQSRPFVELAGKPLIEYSLKEAAESKLLDRVVVATDDDEVIAHVEKNYPGFFIFKREGQLASHQASLIDLSKAILNHFEKVECYFPEALCMLYASTPLRKAKHIDHAIDTMTIFDTDSVISIQEEFAPCYQHDKNGLVSINNKSKTTRLERNQLYKENGAIFLTKVSVIKDGDCFGEKVGHVTMLPMESVKLNTDFEFWLAEKIITERNS